MYSQQFKDQIECFAHSLDRKANDLMFTMSYFTSTQDRVSRIAKASRRYEQATHLRRTFINPPTLHLPLDL